MARCFFHFNSQLVITWERYASLIPLSTFRRGILFKILGLEFVNNNYVNFAFNQEDAEKPYFGIILNRS